MKFRAVSGLLIILIIAIGCTSRIYVERVIDGDTFEDETGRKFRLIGVNTPEKGEPCYEEALLYTESRLLGKNVDIKQFGKDKYGRELVEVYVNNENLNIELLKNGYANAYYGDVDNNDWRRYINAEELGYYLDGCIWKGDWKKSCVKSVQKNSGEFEVKNLCNVTIDTNIIIKDTSASHRIDKHLFLKPYESIIINEGCKTNNKTIGICQHIFNKEGDELIIYSHDGLILRVPYGRYENK